MRGNKLGIGEVCVLCLGLMALPAGADTCTWSHPCPCGDRSGNGEWVCGFGGSICRCETDWDTSGNWDCSGPPPDSSSEIATILHSNHGCCATGDCDCSVGSDCTGGCSGSCGDDERWLMIEIPTDTINGLEITTEDVTGTTTDELEVRFESAPSGAKTLTVLYLALDATNGTLIMRVSDNATITTN